MARFVRVGNSGMMINVEQITAIYQNRATDKYEVDMTSGTTHYVTYDEFLEITGQKENQESEKKYAIKVFTGFYPTRFVDRYLVLNRETSIPLISSDDSDSKWQAHFTKEEIETLKNQDDIAIDWDKVELEEVNDNE